MVNVSTRLVVNNMPYFKPMKAKMLNIALWPGCTVMIQSLYGLGGRPNLIVHNLLYIADQVIVSYFASKYQRFWKERELYQRK
ncbi:hypothetical protein A4D02_05415 [Niastella koreensis]|uniref:Uncharacterized protein n=1 Tax=Niastella koreensis TaxID=354356 RepID=A0ABX3NV90_9BACT|nr:hypothetical protein A4D02_05415 [Niastella koreensis]